MLRRRLGSALFLIATIALLVFLVTLSAGSSDLRFMFWGLALAGCGWLLRRSAPRPSQRPRRFRSLRRMLGEAPPDDFDPQDQP